jgi:hypothetical protein
MNRLHIEIPPFPLSDDMDAASTLILATQGLPAAIEQLIKDKTGLDVTVARFTAPVEPAVPAPEPRKRRTRAEIVKAQNGKGPASEDPDADALAAIREAMARGAAETPPAPGRKSHAARVAAQGATHPQGEAA